MKAKRGRLRICGILILAGLAVWGKAALADESQFTNAKLETQAVTGNLGATIDRIAKGPAGPLWIAYEVDAVSSKDTTCCGDTKDGYCGLCRLEGGSGISVRGQNTNTTVKLEKAALVTVLYRVSEKHVMRIRIASANCALDAGGLRVVWLTGVKPKESVEVLSEFVKSGWDGGDKDDGVKNEALMAIAQHADHSADVAYANFVAPNQPSELRGKASFWLGAARGKPGLTVLEKMAKTDPSAEVRDKVVFGMFVSHEPEAIDDIIRLAKDDSDAHVRGQALFWLAQKAGQKASGTIGNAIVNDPDTEVKKKAVFALTQMPHNEGVPKLIEVAQNNKNPEVRKQAMFWLGQSQDPRALAFFEKILSE